MIRSVILLLLSALLLGTRPEHVEDETGAGESVRVEGLVVDRETNEPLAGAKIEIKSMDLAIYSDFDGHFEIRTLKAGVYSIQASYISYQDEQINHTLLKGPVSNLIISLKP